MIICGINAPIPSDRQHARLSCIFSRRGLQTGSSGVDVNFWEVINQISKIPLCMRQMGFWYAFLSLNAWNLSPEPIYVWLYYNACRRKGLAICQLLTADQRLASSSAMFISP